MKRYWMLLVLLAMGLSQAQAQKSGLLEGLFGNDDTIIEKALKQACVVVRQDYVIKDSLGVPYGSGQLPYFGRAYGIGVVSNGFLWTSQRVRQPWIWDANYTGYSKTHTAAPYEMAWKEVEADSFGVSKEWDAQMVGGAAVGALPQDGGTARPGVYQGDTLTEQGRLAVFYIEEGEHPDSAEIQMATALVEDIQWEEDGKAEEEAIKLKGKQLLGGALFTEHIGPGSITFKLSGLYVKTTRLNDPWKLQKLVLLENTVPTPTPSNTQAPNGASFIPKGKRRKKNKN